jgi:hypothetical protein
MSLQVDLLRDNFQEIYHAVHTSSPSTLPLVANYSGTRIYDARMGWGRLWMWFYRFSCLWSNQDLRLEKLRSAILNTHSLFHRQMRLVNDHLSNYHCYLQRASKGYKIDETAFKASRKAITSWNTATKPFIQMMQKMDHCRMRRLLEYCFKAKLQPKEAPPFFTMKESRQLRNCQALIDIEGTLHSPLPLIPIRKFIRGKPLNTIDLKEINKWIKQANKSVKSAAVLHKALGSLTEEYSKKEDLHKKTNAAALEMFLESKGCTLFELEDAKHLQWRQQLKAGSKLIVENEELTLADEICSSYSELDKVRVFAIKEKPECVVLIAQNKAALPMRFLKHQAGDSYGIAPASFFYIAGNGAFALMERLQPLNSIQWSSSQGKISKEDEPILNSLVNLLQWLVKQNHTPSRFTADSIMFDNQYRLKSLKPASKQDFDFNALEDFTFQCAAGNLTIFQHLMTGSGLHKHAAAKFYQDLLANSLNKDTTAIEDLAGIYKIGDPKVVDRGAELIKKIFQLHNPLYKKARELFPNLNPKDLNAKVNSALIASYQSTKGAGLIWPSLTQEAISRLSQTAASSP